MNSFFFHMPPGAGGAGIPPDVLEALSKGQQGQPQQPSQEKKAQTSFIDGEFKEIEDDPSLPVAKLDKWIGHAFIPYNYDPKTGEVHV